MSIVDKVKKAGVILGTATGLTIGLGAAQALAHCTVIVTAAPGKTLDGKNQAVGGVKVITNQMASGPKESWAICTRYAEAWLAAARPFGAVGMRQKMECSGSWKGEWCKDVLKGDVKVSFGNYKNYSGVFSGDGINAFLKAARGIRTNDGAKTEVEVPRIKVTNKVIKAETDVVIPRRPVAEVESTGGSKLIRRRADGFSEFKCQC